jgi:hypothetical protein
MNRVLSHLTVDPTPHHCPLMRGDRLQARL